MTDHQDTPAPTTMETEPALSIGELFADKAMLRTQVAAIASFLAFTSGWVIPDEQIGNIVTMISGLGFLITYVVAQIEARQRATEQARITRENVFAPATARAMARSAVTPMPAPDGGGDAREAA